MTGTDTLILRILAIILRQSGLFAPPPQIFVSVTFIPRLLATSNESRIANATPSRTACVISVLSVSIVIPVNVALAAGLLCGERSPIRYGRKNTLLFPSISSVMGFCSSEYSFVFIISSIHHLLHEAALSIQPIR